MLSAGCSTNTASDNCEWIKVIHPVIGRDECISFELADQIYKHNKKVEANCP